MTAGIFGGNTTYVGELNRLRSILLLTISFG